jgi:hypothetical protein
MKAPRLKCPETNCRERPKGALQLNFHIQKAHPGSVDAYRPIVKRAYAEERIRLAEERNDPSRIWAKLKGLYANCPCGKDLEWHRAAFNRSHPRSV